MNAQPSPITFEEDRPLLEEVVLFIRQWHLSDTQFGSMAVGSPQFVRNLREGRCCRATTQARVREFMAKGDPRPKGRTASRFVKYRQVVRRNAQEAKRQATFRTTDPVELAKTFIRAQRFVCFEAAITRPEHHGKYFVGTNLVDREGLLEFARKRGWAGV